MSHGTECRVTAVQHGKVILEMIASFHRAEDAADWQPPVVPALEFDDAVLKTPTLGFADRFDMRVTPGDDSAFAVPPFWIRTRDPIEDDPLIRACALTFLSDFGPVPVARPPGVPLDPHVGSIAIRRFVEQRQPLVTLHGHVHEAARLSGNWRERLGRSWCFTAAHDGDELALVAFDPERPDAAIRQLL